MQRTKLDNRFMKRLPADGVTALKSTYALIQTTGEAITVLGMLECFLHSRFNTVPF